MPDLFGNKKSSANIKREITALSIKNNKPSAPTQWAYAKGYVQPVVFDWGCGRGRDSRWLKSQGLEVISYDPFYQPSPCPRDVNFKSVQTILLNYVLNVIEEPVERLKLLKEIKKRASPNTRVIISARSDEEIEFHARKSHWQRYNDGYITQKRTFQKGFSLEELVAFSSFLGETVDTTDEKESVVCAMRIKKE